jgi:hypothetical protein
MKPMRRAPGHWPGCALQRNMRTSIHKGGATVLPRQPTAGLPAQSPPGLTFQRFNVLTTALTLLRFHSLTRRVSPKTFTPGADSKTDNQPVQNSPTADNEPI